MDRNAYAQFRTMFGTSFIAKRVQACACVNAAEHKRGGDGSSTRWEHGDKDVSVKSIRRREQ